MSIGRIDLNLMKVFDAVYEDRNLLRAARRLNLSPSAVSHALARLRELVGDELFVRTANGMIPTARSIAMAEDLRESLRKIIATLGAEPFDPLTSTHRFTIASNGHLTSRIVAELSRLMITEAPGVDLVIRPSTRLDLAEQIDVGRIDLALGVFQQVPERYSSQILTTQGDLVIMRKGHPASRRKLTLQDLARYPLVTVSVGGQEEGAVGGFILERGLARQSEMFDRRALETALSAIGATPRYRITMPHWSAIAALLDGTDMLSITPALPSRVGFRETFVTRQPPYPTEPSIIRGVWHSRNDHHPAQTWLRKTAMRAGEAAFS